MDIKHVGIQEPRGFDEGFNNGFPITELENNEIEVPYYESDAESEASQVELCDTESDYASSSDESVVSRGAAKKIHRTIPNYKTLLCIETDFLPE